jgi:hypothetical protein
MGCDIHTYVEVKKNGQWVSADTWETETYDDREVMHVPYGESIYSGRNYDLFAILADVRNGVGFAGCDTGEGFVPISSPKGLPEDVTDEVKSVSEAWAGDAHSHSWVTLAELLAYDWTQTTTLRGYVNAVTYYEWNRYDRKRGDGPDSCSGDVFGQDIKKVSNDEMDTLIAEAVKDQESPVKAVKETLGNVYTQAEWTMPYYACASNFFLTVIPKLLRLGAPEDVRLVFFFDN